MTGNQIKGRGFRGALRYNLAKVGKNVAEVLDSSFSRSTEQGIMKEVQMIRSLRPRLQKYFYHTSINFPPGESPDNKLMKQIGLDYLAASGFHENQYIMFRHHDAGHPHLHILVNRIGYDARVVSDSNDFQRSEKILRTLEVRYNLTRVAPSREAIRKAPTKNELEMTRRTGQPSKKLKLQQLVSSALKSRPSALNFINSLQLEGVNVAFNQATTGYVSGISYELDGFRIAGAKLGREFKWSYVRARIDYNADRDRMHIQQANSRVSQSFQVPEKISERRIIKPGERLQAPESEGLFKATSQPHVLENLFHPDSSFHEMGQLPRPRRKRRKKRRKG